MTARARWVACLLACSLPAPLAAQSRYLYVWAGAKDSAAAPRPATANGASHSMHSMGGGGGRSDFLAVIDLRPDSTGSRSRYGRLVAITPIATAGTVPHHAEQTFASGHRWFTSGFASGQLFLFDAAVRAHPRLVAQVDSVPGLRKPHSLVRLPNGHVLATVQFGPDSVHGRPGGIVELDDAGHVLRTASSRDSAFRDAPIRTYGITAVPRLDRFVTTSSAMDDEQVADVIQVWRLSDLKLLRTIAMPPRADSISREPFEVRVLSDGRSVLVNTWRCGLLRVAALETLAPRVEFVLSMQTPRPANGCAVPVVVGRYWVMPIAYQHRVAVLDVSRPGRPREVSSLSTDSTFFPHWSAADPLSDRVVITEQGDGPPRVLLARLDSATGRLRWDDRFREPGASRPGLEFSRDHWPDGSAGASRPHAAVFVPER